jgi:phosphoribosylamine--glycine ligase
LAHTPADVDGALRKRGELGQAGERLLIEELMEGPELSVLAFADGERLAIMPPARDYKRVFDGDRGPNTGGMGAYTWPSDVSDALLEEIVRSVLRPTLDGMAAEGAPYRGVLYAGLMLTRDGPRVLEYNCRFGDPESQVILPLLESDLFDVCQAVTEGRLDRAGIRWREAQTYGVVLAAAGYPDAPRLGDAISGLEGVDALAFHAGTEQRGGSLVTSGGRVLTLVAQSRAEVYAAAERVQFAGKHYRTDIGQEAAVAAR